MQIRTKEFAIQVIRMYSALPESTEARVPGKQVLRSGTSVGANYREASRARSKPESIAKIGDCLKELDETAYWLELLAESSMVAEARLVELRDECDQLLAIFTPISKKAKANASQFIPHTSSFAAYSHSSSSSSSAFTRSMALKGHFSAQRLQMSRPTVARLQLFHSTTLRLPSMILRGGGTGAR